MKIGIRKALETDAEDMAHIHFASVHEIGAKSYPKEICFAWSPKLTNERIKQFHETILAENEIMFVAIIEEKVAGFASFIPKYRELKALYVDPKFSRQGVGRELLKKLEFEARAHGIECLIMEASLSAEVFYKRHGYVEIKRVIHTLKSGNKMPGIKMAKSIN